MSEMIYEKPSIIKTQSQLASKYGMSSVQSQQSIRTEIEGVSINQLCEDHGSPLFVFSEQQIINDYQRAKEAFQSVYPDVQFAWSYKTNYLQAICALFHKQGSIAEVVSEFEYNKARKLGIAGKDIIFNGPYKPMNSLERAVNEGAKIHIDSFAEITDLESIAKRIKKKIPVGIRINLNAGTYPQWSKFGFNLESGQARDALKRIIVGGHLKITGIHSHLGTFLLDASTYERGATKLMDFYHLTHKMTGHYPQYIDLGGGFASKSHLKGVYQPPELAVPKIEDYAQAIASGIKNNLRGAAPPKLFLETGRHLIDESGFLINSVISDKCMPDGRRAYIVDGGVHLLYTSSWYDYRVEIDRQLDSAPELACINGALCMNIDVIEEKVLLPRLERGTRLIFSPVGAYNVTQSMQFIHCRPAVVLVRQSGEVDVIRRAETLEDIEIAEQLPKNLEL